MTAEYRVVSLPCGLASFCEESLTIQAEVLLYAALLIYRSLRCHIRLLNSSYVRKNQIGLLRG